jgi:glycosyltransferase involved in cell wall biosynthesis
MSRVLLLGTDPEQRPIPLESQYRNLNLAASLARKGHDVSVALALSDAVRATPAFSSLRFVSETDAGYTLRRGVCDVAIVPLELLRPDWRCPVPLVINLQGPVFTATIPVQDRLGGVDAYYFGKRLAMLHQALRAGDFFVCAGESQRMFYLGLLSAAGRCNPLTLGGLDKLMGIVRPGVPWDPPSAYGVCPSAEEPVVLWPSGVYDWYDPFAVIRGFRKVSERIERAKLVFAGAQNPHAGALCKANLARLRALVDEQGLGGKVDFIDWAPYDKRAALYAGATLGICTYRMSLETELAWRARVVDMLWGGLPVVLSRGDELSRLVAAGAAGAVLDSHDPDHVAAVMLDLLMNPQRMATLRGNVQRLVREHLNWDSNILPLHQFCEAPCRAKDKVAASLYAAVDAHVGLTVRSGLSERICIKGMLMRGKCV